MTAGAILDRLIVEGVTLLERDGVLLARPLEPLTGAQRDLIEAHRDALLSEVQRRPAFVKALLTECHGRILEERR